MSMEGLCKGEWSPCTYCHGSFFKVYVHLCKKWKAYNRIIVVQDAPQGLHKAPPDRPPQLLATAVKTPSSASAGPSSPAANSGNQAGASTSGQQVREVAKWTWSSSADKV